MSEAIGFHHSFMQELPDAAVACAPEPVEAPLVVFFNQSLARQLQLPFEEDHDSTEFAQLLAGNCLPTDAAPIAQKYAGHQFGQYNPRLGDGRAVILGELIDRDGARWDWALKGSGRTPFSRGGDGRAVLGPMLREVLISEAMHSMGVPVTRALSVVTTGERVYRKRLLPGAVLGRIAASHIRVGSFQHFAAFGDYAQVQALADYTLQRHYPELVAHSEPYLALLEAVCDAQASLVAKWMGLGFIHGVMNTDNVCVSGETIDFGPCAFMEAYDPATVFSSIDTGGRYAYGQQPAIMQWNMARLAEALLPVMAGDSDKNLESARAIIGAFAERYEACWLANFTQKLGLDGAADEQARRRLIEQWLALLQKHSVDFTNAHRLLGDYPDDDGLLALFGDGKGLQDWLQHRAKYLAVDAAQVMAEINPQVIPRNHLVESVLVEANETHDCQGALQLLSELAQPFARRDRASPLLESATPEFNQVFRTFCGT